MVKYRSFVVLDEIRLRARRVRKMRLFVLFLISVLKNELLLHEAVIKNDPDAVKRVIKEPLDVNSRNNVSIKRNGISRLLIGPE